MIQRVACAYSPHKLEYYRRSRFIFWQKSRAAEPQTSSIRYDTVRRHLTSQHTPEKSTLSH